MNPLIKKPLVPGAAYGGVELVDGVWHVIFDVHKPCFCTDGKPNGCTLDARYSKPCASRQAAYDEVALISDALELDVWLMPPISLVIAGSRSLSPSIDEISASVARYIVLASAPQLEVDLGVSREEAAAVLVRGGPRWPDVARSFIHEVVCGDAAGSDDAGAAWAVTMGIPVHHEPITSQDITRWGKYLGPRIRNSRLADRGDVGLVFWDGKSGGTADFVTRMVLRGKRVEVVPMRKAPGPRARRRRRA
jgi:hypothetical protein